MGLCQALSGRRTRRELGGGEGEAPLLTQQLWGRSLRDRFGVGSQVGWKAKGCSQAVARTREACGLGRGS